MSERDWDGKRIAAECAKAAAEKGATPASERRGVPPPIPVTTMEPLPRTEGDEFTEELKATRAGRPTKYKPEYVEQARRLAKIGALNAEMAAFFEVCPATFTLWRNTHPEFEEAVRVGKGGADDRVKRSLYETANGYDYVEEQAIKVRDSDGNEHVQIVNVKRHQPADVRAQTLWLINRQPDEFQVKRTIEHTDGPANVPVEQMRRELAEFFKGKDGQQIDGQFVDVTPAALPAPIEQTESRDF